MATPLALVWDLIATDNASAVFKKVGVEAGAASKETSGLGSMFTKMGGILAIAGAAMTVVAVKMAMDMQETTAKIQGNAQITQKAAVGIGDAFLATAGKSTFSGKSMAEAFAPVAGVVQSLSGKTLTAADSMKVMTAATTLAEASGKPLGATTADLAAVMQNYGLKVGDAAEASNVLFNASRLTNIDLDTLTATVDKLHGKLGIASPSLADTSSLLVDLANHGISGSKGVLVVNSALTSLLGGSKGSTAELKTLGIHVFDASGKFVGMKGVLDQLTPKLKDMTDKQRLAAESALFGSGAAKAMNATIMAGAVGLGKATAAVTKHNAVENAAKAASATLGGQLKTLKAAFTDVMVIIGEKVIPVIQKAVTWLTQHKVVVEVLAGIIGGIMVVAVTAWTVSLIANAVAMVAATWPILAVMAGIALLVAGVIYAYNHFKVFHDVVDAVWSWLKSAVVTTIGFVKDHWQLIVGIFLGPIVLLVALIVTHWDEVKTKTVAAWNGIISFFTGIPGKIVGALGNLGDLLKEAGGAIMGGFLHGITAGFDKIKGVVSGVASWISSHKGPIEYDRQLLVPHGGAIMDGLNEGLTTGFGKVQGNVGSMAGRLSIGSLDFATSAVRSNAVGSLSRPSSGSGATITNNIYEATSAQATALQVSRRQAALGAV